MRAAWPAARPTHTILKFFVRSANTACSGLWFLRVLHPADELISSERRNVHPRLSGNITGQQ